MPAIEASIANGQIFYVNWQEQFEARFARSAHGSPIRLLFDGAEIPLAVLI